ELFSLMKKLGILKWGRVKVGRVIVTTWTAHSPRLGDKHVSATLETILVNVAARAVLDEMVDDDKDQPEAKTKVEKQNAKIRELVEGHGPNCIAPLVV